MTCPDCGCEVGGLFLSLCGPCERVAAMIYPGGAAARLNTLTTTGESHE